MSATILICEDNKLELKIISTYISSLSQEFKVTCKMKGFSDFNSAIDYCRSEIVDIAFLDINFGIENERGGIDIARALLQFNKNAVIIFVTGEVISAPEAYEVRAFDYINKPIDTNKMRIVYVRAINQYRMLNSRKKVSPFIITTDNLKKKIDQNSILFIEKKQNKSVINLKKQEAIAILETIKSLISRLNENFIQISQSCIVNKNEIETIRNNKVYLYNGLNFSIGRNIYKKS